MANNSQETRMVLGTLRCRWCFRPIDEETQRCSRMCYKATVAKKLDELQDQLDAERAKESENNSES